jgi:CheY-like chemotaxis protein
MGKYKGTKDFRVFMASILVVDDEPLIRFLLTASLSRLQHHVTQAQNGVEALQCLEHQGSFDLVITDLRMPQLDGVELLMILRYAYPALPLMVLSAYPEDFTLALRHGAPTLLQKPFSRQQLIDTVNSTLNATPSLDGFIRPSR